MSALVELSGQTFGRLTVIKRSGYRRGKHVYWDCICSCGRLVARRSDNLLIKQSQSCGCLQLEKVTKHGNCSRRFEDPRVRLWLNAKQRATKHGFAFTITVNDIPEVPSLCPILSIPIKLGKGKVVPGSPSLDRIIPQLGYVPGNIQVISHRANTIKSDATAEELQKVANFVKTAEDTVNRLTYFVSSPLLTKKYLVQ